MDIIKKSSAAFLAMAFGKAALVCLYAVLYGCASGPGEPIVRTGISDGQGAIIPKCRNVSNADKTSTFIKNRYLTTWGSAAREGSAAGLYDGMKEGLKDSGARIDDTELKQFAYNQLPQSETFCKAYSASPDYVFRAVSAILSSLAYKPVISSQNDGLLTTQFFDGAHYFYESKHPFVKWKDRFIVTVMPSDNTSTIVKILRDVYIARCNAKTGECSDYLRATSVGHNEAMILNQITKELP